MADALRQVGCAAEQNRDPIPRPADRSDVVRWSRALGAISEETCLPALGVSMGSDGRFQGYFRVDGRLDSKKLDKELKQGK